MFKFIHQNGLHWDVYHNDARAFKIRGDEKSIFLIPDHVGGTVHSFPSLESCMAYVCAYYIKSVK